MVHGAGEGDAESVEAIEEGITGNSGVLCPALDVSPAFRRGSEVSKYFDLGFRGTQGMRSGSGSAS
jgi:hypothetical protein